MTRTAFSELPADLRRLIRRGPAAVSEPALPNPAFAEPASSKPAPSEPASSKQGSPEPVLPSAVHEIPTQAGKLAGSLARASGLGFLDPLLPDAGIPLGQVTELAVNPRSSLGTRAALHVCRAAQQSQPAGEEMPWCAFIDPSGTLYAPGVQANGVALDRLLVLRPEPEAVARIAVKLAESNLFSVIVIDTVLERFQQSEVPHHARRLPQQRSINDRLVRRLALAVQNTATQIVLLTDLNQTPGAALPVALRVELTRTHLTELQVGIAKDRFGRGGRVQRALLNATGSAQNSNALELGGGVRSTRPRELREKVGAA